MLDHMSTRSVALVAAMRLTFLGIEIARGDESRNQVAQFVQRIESSKTALHRGSAEKHSVSA